MDSNDHGPSLPISKMVDSDNNKHDLEERDSEKSPMDQHQAVKYPEEEHGESTQERGDHQLSEGEIRDKETTAPQAEQGHIRTHTVRTIATKSQPQAQAVK